MLWWDHRPVTVTGVSDILKTQYSVIQFLFYNTRNNNTCLSLRFAPRRISSRRKPRERKFFNMARTFLLLFCLETSSAVICVYIQEKPVLHTRNVPFPIPIWLNLTNGLNLCALCGNLSLTLAGILLEQEFSVILGSLCILHTLNLGK